LQGSSKLKAPGGKLVSIRISYSDKIERVQIMGDFFLHPEESISMLEDCMSGMPINSTKEQISSQISRVADDNRIEMIGITPDSIAEAVLMAIK
jgi:hypothetical protein